MVKKEMIAMLLAGDQNSQLGVLTEKVAKPAVSFGGKYRVIDFPLSNCINSGIDTVGILTRRESSQLHEHIGIGIPWDLDKNAGGVTILPPYGEGAGATVQTGAAHAVFRNMAFIENCHPEYVLVLSGDHIYKMDYEVMLDYHKAEEADVTIAVMPVSQEEAHRFGIVVSDQEGHVTQLQERPDHPGSSLASMGVCIFNWKVLQEALTALADLPECDFGKHILPYCFEKGYSLAAYEFTGYWKDISTLRSYWETGMELIDIIPAFNLYEEFWRIYTGNDVIGPQYISGKSYITRSLIGDGTEVYGNVENSIVGNNVTIAEGAVVRDSIVMDGCVIGRGAILDKAIVAAHVVIGNNAMIGTGDFVPNRLHPEIYDCGLAVIGEDSGIPAGVRIGRNTAVSGRTLPGDYPGMVLPGGEILDRTAASWREPEKDYAHPAAGGVEEGEGVVG